ncbi:MAG: hypothetical protein KIT31_34960 [Deltaproteobacteria bacterium]|nr:hypothetical protein [Deltaproteobacteria bacterium]
MGLRAIALVALLAFGTAGCFGYNRGAKGWSYVGNSILILGGGGIIAADQLNKEKPGNNVPLPNQPPQYDPPFSGALLAGVILATAGLVGILFNATRPTVNTSR